MTSPANQFEFVMNELTRTMRRVYNRLFMQAGVSAQQAAVLLFLDRYGQQSQNELADRMELGKAAVAALLARMEDAGLVARTADSDDRRVRIVSLTPAAQEAIDRINDLAVDLGKQLREGTTESERRQAIAVLNRMKQNLARLEEGGLIPRTKTP